MNTSNSNKRTEILQYQTTCLFFSHFDQTCRFCYEHSSFKYKWKKQSQLEKCSLIKFSLKLFLKLHMRKLTIPRLYQWEKMRVSVPSTKKQISKQYFLNANKLHQQLQINTNWKNDVLIIKL